VSEPWHKIASEASGAGLSGVFAISVRISVV